MWFKSNRGGTLFSTAVALSGVCLSLGAITLFYGRAINVQENNQRDLRIASLNARSGLDATLARARSGEVDVQQLVSDASITAKDLATALLDTGCNYTEVEAWRTPAAERDKFDARLMVVEAATSIGTDLIPWVRVDATGESNGKFRTLSTYIRPRANGGGGARRIPMWLMGIATSRQLKLGQGPGWFELYAFNSMYDPFSYTPAWGRDWADTGAYRREPGFTDALVGSLGQIDLEGRIWGDVMTSLEYSHEGSYGNAMSDFQPWDLDKIDPETGMFDAEFYALHSGTETGDQVTAVRISDNGHVAGNLEVSKGDIVIEEASSAYPNNGVAGTIHAGLGQTEITVGSDGQVGATDSELAQPATVTLEDGTEVAFGSDLYNHAVYEAQHLAYENGAGSFDAYGSFTQGHFTLPPSVPVINLAVAKNAAGELTEDDLGYDPDLHIGYISSWSQAPTLYNGAATPKTSLYSWLTSHSTVIVKRGKRISKHPSVYEYKDHLNRVVGTGQYGWGKSVTMLPDITLVPVTYYQISTSYTSSSWRSPSNVGQQCRTISVPSYCRANGSRRSNRQLRNIYSDGASGSGCYIPNTGVCEYGSLIPSQNGDGVYTFNSITMDSSRSRWKIDLSNGSVIVYVNGDTKLDRGYFDVVGSEGNAHEFKLVVGGVAGGEVSEVESEEYVESEATGVRLVDNSVCRVCINMDTDNADFTIQAANLEVNYNVSLQSNNDISVWYSGTGKIGDNGNSYYGNIIAEGDLRVSAGGPARVDGNTVTAYGNIVCEGRTCLVAGGDAYFETYPNPPSETGSGAMTGVLQLSGRSVIDVGGDVVADVGSVWFSGSSPTWNVDGQYKVFAQDAFAMDYSGKLANLNHPAQIYVNLDNGDSNLGSNSYVDSSYSGYHAESMYLEPNSFRLCHCHDFWGGMFAPNSKAFVLHSLNWFGAAFAGHFDPGSAFYEFHQDLAMRDIQSETYEANYDDVLIKLGAGIEAVVGVSVASFLANTSYLIEAGSRYPWGSTLTAANPLSMTVGQIGASWNAGRLSGWSRTVPESFLVEGGDVTFTRVEDKRYEWACYVQNKNLTGNADALYTHKDHAQDHMGRLAIEAPTGGYGGSGTGGTGGSNDNSYIMDPTNVVFDRSLNRRCAQADD